MDANRINVGILRTDHALASQAAGLTVQAVQDFATSAVRTEATRIIKDFRAGKTVHVLRDNRDGKKKQ